MLNRIGSAKYSHDEIWTIPYMNYSLAMPDYKVFDLKVTSSGGNIAQVVFNPAPQGTPNPVTISVNDEANRNCSI
nr:hypothetical protein [Francisella tularensis]